MNFESRLGRPIRRAARRVLFAVVTGFGLIGDPAHAQTVVAKAEHEVPTANSYNINVCVPVPPGTVAGGVNPFSFRMPNGTIVPTQLEVVSNYGGPPSSALDPDIVELVARITKDPTWVAGTKQTIDVVLASSGPIAAHTPGMASLLSPASLPSVVQTAINDPKFLAVFAVDPMGAVHVAYPFAASSTFTPIRQGVAQSTQCSFSTMTGTGIQPVGGYPHFLSVHAYLSTLSNEPVITADFRISNGLDGKLAGSGDDSLGKVYFLELMLGVRRNVTTPWIAQDQFTRPFGPNGQAPVVRTIGNNTYDCYPLVKANAPSGGVTPMHPMGALSQFHRRMVLSPVANATLARRIQDLRGQAFAIAGTGLWSYMNAATARFFPQRTRLPVDFSNLSYPGASAIESTVTPEYLNLRNALANGTPSTGFFELAPVDMGWMRPVVTGAGITSGGGGDPSGHWITFLEGYRAILARSLNVLRLHRLLHELVTERQSNVVWTSTGIPTYQDRWLEPSPNPNDPLFPAGSPTAVPSRSQVSFYMDSGSSPSPFTNDLPWTQNQVVLGTAGLRPAWDGSYFWQALSDSYLATNMFAFEPIWASHLSRYMMNAMALAWITNDPLSKTDLVAQAEMYRLTVTEYPNPIFNHGSSLYSLKNSISPPNQHKGFSFGRDDGWGTMVASAAYALSDSTWRSRNRSWFDRVLEVVKDGRLNPQIDPFFTHPVTGLPYTWSHIYVGGLNAFDVCVSNTRRQQSWEEMILLNGLRSVERSVYGTGELQRVDLNSIGTETAFGLVNNIHWDQANRWIFDFVPITDANGTPYTCDATVGCFGGNPAPIGCGAPVNPSSSYASSGAYVFNLYANAIQSTGDLIFLHRGMEQLGMTVGCSSTPTCSATLKSALESAMIPSAFYVNGINIWWSESAFIALLGAVQ